MTRADTGHGGKPSSEERPRRALRRNPIDPEAVPAALCRAMARVQADFETATDLECSLWFEAEPELGFDSGSDRERESLMCMVAAGGSAWGFSIDLDSDEEEAAVRIADEGTEQVFEALGDTDSWEVAARWPP